MSKQSKKNKQSKKAKQQTQQQASGDIQIQVYLDNGVKFMYNVTTPAKAREHADAILKTGYRSVNEEGLECYPPHRIHKVKAVGPGITSDYHDVSTGT